MDCGIALYRNFYNSGDNYDDYSKAFGSVNMKLIAAVDNNWGIGNNNQLLFKIPEDLKRFKSFTTGNLVVMGINTFTTLPGYPKPLPDRINFIISSEYFFLRKYSDDRWGCNLNTFIHNLKFIATLAPEIFVIGGASIYEQLLPYCETAYITKCFQSFEADKFMVNLETKNNWKLTESSKIKTYKDLNFQFLTFTNVGI